MGPDRQNFIELHRSTDETTGDPIVAGLVPTTDGSGSFTWEAGGGGPEEPFDHGAMGSTETFDLDDGEWHRGTLDANCTITVTGFTADEAVVAMWEIVQDGTGGWDITWDADVDFGGADDQPNQAAGSYTAFLLWSSEGDSTIYGAKVGGGSSLSDDTPLVDAGAGDPGVSDEASRSDHVHPASSSGGVGEILISDTHSTPLVFADLLQNEAGDDLLYADT